MLYFPQSSRNLVGGGVFLRSFIFNPLGLVLLSLFLLPVLLLGNAGAVSSLFGELEYVTPDATPNGREVLIVGSNHGSSLSILEGGSLYTITLLGVDFPKLNPYDGINLSVTRIMRNIVGLKAIVESSKKFNLEGPAYLWIKDGERTILLQSLILSNGLGNFNGQGYINFYEAEQHAKSKGLGIWEENRETLTRTTASSVPDKQTTTTSEHMSSWVELIDVRIFDNGLFGLITLVTRETGSLAGTVVSIVSNTDITKDEDSFTINDQKELKAGESYVVLLTIDRAQIPSFNYNTIWVTYLDPNGGFLRLKNLNGARLLYEYEYSRKINGYVVTPLN